MDPIAKLIDDHRRFLRTLDEFRGGLTGPGPKGSGPKPLARRVADFAEFLTHDVDRIHGQQEERGLFPALGRYLPTDEGPIAVMVGEHEALRGLERALEREGSKLESDPEADEAKRTIIATTGGVADLLSQHVLKEDSVLFPMAYQLLSPRELDEVWEVFREVELTEGSRATTSPDARSASAAESSPRHE